MAPQRDTLLRSTVSTAGLKTETAYYSEAVENAGKVVEGLRIENWTIRGKGRNDVAACFDGEDSTWRGAGIGTVPELRVIVAFPPNW